MNGTPGHEPERLRTGAHLTSTASEPGAARRLPRLFRSLYGEPPLHLLILLASFALCGYAAARLLAGDWFAVAEWFAGAALIHDLLLVPLYGGSDWLLHKALGSGRCGRAGRPPADGGPPAARDAVRHAARLAVVNHVRVPAFVSLLLLLVYWPSISQDAGARYRADTLLSADVFLGRWLLVTAVLFAASGLLLGLRLLRARPARTPRRGTGTPPRDTHG
jgi:hypothetical protein